LDLNRKKLIDFVKMKAAEGRINQIAAHMAASAGEDKDDNQAHEMKFPLLEQLKGKMNGVEKKSHNTWMVTGYHAGKAIFDNSDFVTAQRSEFQPDDDAQFQKFKQVFEFFEPWVLFNDPPMHTRLRNLFFQFLSAKSVLFLKGTITETAHYLLDLVEKRGRMDARSDYSKLFPILIFARILGAPKDDQTMVKDIAFNFGIIVGGPFEKENRLDISQEIIDKSVLWIETLWNTVGKDPQSDTLLRQIYLATEAQRAKGLTVSDKEIFSNLILLIFGATDTLKYSLPSSLIALLDHPDQLDLFTNHWDEVKDTAINELLRFCGPVRITVRIASSEILVRNELTMKKGDIILLNMPAMNRDAGVFTKPDVLDLKRKNNPHVAFGSGRHQCLGRFLAKLELEIGLRVLLQRFPNIKLAVPRNEIAMEDAPSVVGVAECPVLLH